eukprot:TRINITY_DN46678_c0_g1_i1.p1 TRINITY_DN46678_c0_g1~~TRINITY_DN46678_c0_g1_i1.p1  ORF type:complete len:275 (+),score=87.17 TRINITY_DN46678_c0_g1_i1:37-825(+)
MEVAGVLDEVLNVTPGVKDVVVKELGELETDMGKLKADMKANEELKKRNAELLDIVASKKARRETLTTEANKQKELTAERGIRREMLEPLVAKMKENQFSAFVAQVRNERKEVIAETNRLRDTLTDRVKTAMQQIIDKTSEGDDKLSEIVFSKLGSAPRAEDILNIVYKGFHQQTLLVERSVQQQQREARDREDRRREQVEVEQRPPQPKQQQATWGSKPSKRTDFSSDSSSSYTSSSSRSRTRSSSRSSYSSDEELARPER